MEIWTTIRCLHNKGESIRKIAKLLKISRNTVRKALRENESPKYVRENLLESKCEKYRSDIEEMMFVKRYIGSRIFEEIQKKGYCGEKSAFYKYLNKIGHSSHLEKISEPYETAPGKQMQFDWSPYIVPMGNELTKVTVFDTILGYSRKRKYVGSLDDSQSSVFSALEIGFRYFGGVCEQLLVDNARQMVDNANPLNFKWNVKFLEFTGYFGIEPKHCRIRRAKTKGKVENPFYFLEQHFIKGGVFKNFDDFCLKLDEFNEQVNNRVHSIIKTTPNEKFKEEIAYLKRIPEAQYIGSQEIFRKVSWDSLFSFEGNKYSVPYPWAGKNVWVRKYLGYKVLVCSQKGENLCEHIIPSQKGSILVEKSHYEGLRRRCPKTISVLKNEFKNYFPENEKFLEKLIAQKKFSTIRHLSKILNLRNYYSDEQLRKVFSICMEWNCFSSEVILGVLRSREDIEEKKPNIVSDSTQIETDDVSRGLEYYEKL